MENNSINSVVISNSVAGQQGGPREGGLPADCDALGNTTKLRSPFANDADQRRFWRYLVQNVVAEILPNERVSRCMRMIVPGWDSVKVLYSEEFKRAHYGNLAVCGSIWSCPICAAKITERRRLELETGLANWPGEVFMISYTMQHSFQDSLAQLLKVENKAFHTMQAGKGWQELKSKFSVAGTIGSSEVTWGPVNGWHPHRHVLLFCEKNIYSGQIEEIELEFSERYRNILKSLGGYASSDYGVKFSKGDKFECAKYACKWGLAEEMAKGPVKKGRGDNYSPFEIAELAASGECLYVRLFQEYYWTYKGKKQLHYSRGLRKLLAMDTEKPDIELAKEQDEPAILLAQLARWVWKIICERNLRGSVLQVASSGDRQSVEMFIDLILEGIENAR